MSGGSNKTGSNTKIAGCYPPIHVTFRPDLSAEKKLLENFMKLWVPYNNEC